MILESLKCGPSSLGNQRERIVLCINSTHAVRELHRYNYAMEIDSTRIEKSGIEQNKENDRSALSPAKKSFQAVCLYFVRH